MLTYFLCVIIIVFTSIVDAIMVVAMRTTKDEEQNPLGSYLIEHAGQTGLFTAKMVGTGIVAGVLLFLFKKWTEAAYLVVGVITVFQLSLMYYIFS